MATLTADEIRSRVETDWNRIVKVLAEKVALQSISAKGITAEHMKRSAEFVADELRLVGVDARWSRLQCRRHSGRMGGHRLAYRFSGRPHRAALRPSRRAACSGPGRVEHRPVRGHRNRRPSLRPWLRR